MPFNPALPAANSPVSSVELRHQFNGLNSDIQGKAFEDDCVNRFTDTARNPVNVSPVNLTISDPPTQAEVQAIASKLDELIGNLMRP